jgi:hypothetical protein
MITQIKQQVLLVLIFFVFFSTTSFAQKTFKDVVYLKNGSVAKGKILGFDSLNRLKIQTYKDYFLVFPKEEVKRFIIRGNDEISSSNEQPSIEEKTKGFTNVTQLGVLFGRTDGNQFQQASTHSNFTFESFNGYRFNPYLSAGATVGVDIYSDGTLFPLGGSVRGNLLKGRVTPTAQLTGGHSFEFFSKEKERVDFNGGFFWSAGLGLSVKNNQNSAFVFSLLYKHQNATLRTTNWIWEEEENYTKDDKLYRRFALMLGFSF